jgi:hypothetical protein
MTFDINKADVMATAMYDLRQRGFAITIYEKRMGIKPKVTESDFDEAMETAIRRHVMMAKEEYLIEQMYLL